MAGLERVQPGDLITSALLNAIIDAVAKLGEKVAACQQALDNLPTDSTPTEPGEGEPPPVDTTPGGGTRPPADQIVLDPIVPGSASPGDTVTITGRGFKADSPVSIGGKAAKVLKATAASLDVQVPTLGFTQPTSVDVVVGDPNGVHATAKLTVGPRQKTIKAGIALRSVDPTGLITLDVKKYTLHLVLGSTGRDNLKVTVDAIDPKTGKRRGNLTSSELSFAGATTQNLEVTLPIPKQGVTIEVTMTKKDQVVASQSYTFVIGQEPPLDTGDVFDVLRKR